MQSSPFSSWLSSHRLARAGLVVLLALAGCATGGGASGGGGGESAAAGVGAPVPDLTVDGFWDKKPIRLSGMRGKVVLVDIWASWCAPCKDELPALNEMAGRLASKGIEIVAISVDEDREAAETFLKKHKRWTLTLAHDPAGAVPSSLNPPKMPTSYIIDGKGIVRHVNAGYQAGDARRFEEQLLALVR
jgi:thiol-disulfide isomerase/thioredoxin